MTSSRSTAAFETPDAPAVIEWFCPQRQEPRYSTHGSCTVAFDAPSTTAFFRLRFPVMFKALGSRKTAVFLFVHPERIVSLEQESDVPERVGAALNTDTVGLKFHMDKPAVPVVPDVSLVPKNKASGDALETLQSMSRTTEFTLYLPRKHLSKPRLESLCTITGPDSWRSVPTLSDLPTLYTGKGGKAVEGLDLLPVSDVPPDSPPSYDELVLCPPEPGSSRPGKRRRIEHGAEASSEELIRRLFAEQKAQMSEQIKDEVGRAVEAEVNRVLKGHLDDVEKRLLAEVDSRIGQESSKLREDAREQIDQLREEMDDFKEDVAGETLDQIDLRIDDQLQGIKEELSDHVVEELRNAEERIRGDISATNFSINIE